MTQPYPGSHRLIAIVKAEDGVVHLHSAEDPPDPEYEHGPEWAAWSDNPTSIPKESHHETV